MGLCVCVFRGVLKKKKFTDNLIYVTNDIMHVYNLFFKLFLCSFFFSLLSLLIFEI